MSHIISQKTILSISKEKINMRPMIETASRKARLYKTTVSPERYPMNDPLLPVAGPRTRDDLLDAIQRARALRSQTIRCRLLAMLASVRGTAWKPRLDDCLGRQALAATR
jgi:hypothetical protein